LDVAHAKYAESLAILMYLRKDLNSSSDDNSIVFVAQLICGIEIAIGLPLEALSRLDSLIDIAKSLESFDRPNILHTAAEFWNIRALALDALNRVDECAESQARAAVIRARIASVINPGT
jgi:hypothetical protein